jgi:DNA-binding XRE family transcriptional regulator
LVTPSALARATWEPKWATATDLSMALRYSMLYDDVKDAIPHVLYAYRMETLGDRIRQRREGQGMTQTELAKLVGVTKGAVSQWELGGTKNIKLSTFLKVVEVLHTTTDFLVNGTVPSSTGRYKTLKKPES